MTENLKRCPFCGSEARVEKINLGKQGLFRVICPECLTATTHLREDEKNAVAEWNSRPIENEQSAEIARLRGSIEAIKKILDDRRPLSISDAAQIYAECCDALNGGNE